MKILIKLLIKIKKEKNVNKKNAKKRKSSDSEDSNEEDFKPQKRNIINFLNNNFFILLFINII